MKKTIIFTLFILLALGVNAQRRRTKTPPPPTPEELAEMARKENYERKLMVTERVTFIDSVLLKKSEVLDMIDLGPESGSISTCTDFFNSTRTDTLDCTLFRSQFGDKIIFAQPDTGTVLHLYASEMIGDKWSEQVMLPGLEDTLSHNYPFMLSDGATLYYASKGEESLGGYDIFMTRWDSEGRRFFKPENIGMPFNSEGNDYLYMIDEFNRLGWFVTDRGQNADTVCLYCFIPNETRKIYDTANIGRDTLVSLANINSIRDTWTDKELVREGLKRLSSLRDYKKKTKEPNFQFIVNDNIVYTSFNQVRYNESRNLAHKWANQKQNIKSLSEELDNLRQKYATSNKSKRRELSPVIKSKEQEYEKLITTIYNIEKEIRSYEQR